MIATLNDWGYFIENVGISEQTSSIYSFLVSAAGSATFSEVSFVDFSLPVSKSTSTLNTLNFTPPPQNLLSIHLASFIESLLEGHGSIMIFETDGVVSTLDFSLSEILAEEVPGTVASRVLSLHPQGRWKSLQERSWGW